MTHSKLNELNIAVVSDIHLGHNKNYTRNIIKNLRDAFPDNAETANLDIIFIAGDVFDSLLSLPSEEAIDIKFWIANLMRLCKRRNIILRVLKGTPSHDWEQSRIFAAINDYSKIDADVKYIRELSIEYIEKLGIHVLYVPDEWKPTTEETFTEVLKLLDDNKIQKVDYAIMHGQFGYQLPIGIKAPKHDETNYLSIVKELIFIGHVHTHSQNDRIIAQGSFDRLRHGEEEAKGHVRASIVPDTYRQIKFIENKGAMIFNTIDCENLDIEQTIAKIDSVIDGNIIPSMNLRIEASASNPIFTNFDLLIKRYPGVRWSKLIREDDSSILPTKTFIEETDYTPITISNSNIAQLVADKVRLMGMDETFIDSCMEIINNHS